MRKFLEFVPNCPVCPSRNLLKRINYTITNLYRDALYLFLQHFIYRGQIAFFGTMISPVGCAVAYRSKYIKDMFNKYVPILGDDLTTSEDIFIGFSNLNEGYRNVQLTDVYARSTEPKTTHLLKQIFLWSSSFFQSCYYFNSLLKSPFKSFKRYRYHRSQRKKLGIQTLRKKEKRKIQEPYRHEFGSEYTEKFGRPIGWPILTSLFEKISFPIILLVMATLGWWEALAITIAAETVVSLTILVIVAKGHRIKYLLKGIFLTPIRYAVLLSDLYTLGHFAVDVWILRNRGWRK